MASSSSTLSLGEPPSSSSSSSGLRKLGALNFDNSCMARLPIDPIKENYVRSAVPDSCFSLVEPQPLSNPKLVALSPSVFSLIDLDPSELGTPEFVDYFSGNKVLPGARPAAHCYCGHQFGNFSGQLGDGATMYLGEVINGKQERWEIQFKGAGKTPYSRQGDGRKVLRSSIREFLCSEAMFNLGVPTTRAGTVVTSDTTVVRDMFYDGNPKMERCTVILRVAPTFLRFGSLEIALPLNEVTQRIGPSHANPDIVPLLLRYVIEYHYPEIFALDAPWEEKYKIFYAEICRRTAKLVASWQCNGFCHGVLNTDNMSLVGVTIDYGPFGFMERFDPHHVCNTSDDSRRYSYQAQIKICKWNLMKLAEAIQALLPRETSSSILEETYDDTFLETFLATMRKKLGFFSSQEASDHALVEELLDTMEKTGADFTNTFRLLSVACSRPFQEFFSLLEPNLAPLEVLVAGSSPPIPERHLPSIVPLYRQNPRALLMFGVSPEMVELSISRVEVLKTLRSFTQQEKQAQDEALWRKWFERYLQRLARDNTSDRPNKMNQVNPCFILRNHLLQDAIAKAEKLDFSEVEALFAKISKPYEGIADNELSDYLAPIEAEPCLVS